GILYVFVPLTRVTPSTKTPTPACATTMPQNARGTRRQRAASVLGAPPAGAFNRSCTCCKVPSRIQIASSKPTATPSEACTVTAMAAASSTDTSAGARNASAASFTEPAFHATKGPTDSSTSTGTIKGTKTASKYGGPTEILPRPKASSASGYRVPSSTVPVVTSRKTLLSSSSDSREN